MKIGYSIVPQTDTEVLVTTICNGYKFSFVTTNFAAVQERNGLKSLYMNKQVISDKFAETETEKYDAFVLDSVKDSAILKGGEDPVIVVKESLESIGSK